MKVKVNVCKNGTKKVTLESETGWDGLYGTISKAELEEYKACEYVTLVRKVEPNSWDADQIHSNRSIENLYRIDYNCKFNSKGKSTMGASTYVYAY